LEYSDEYLLEIFKNVNTIAMVGASPNWVRPSHFAMKYLQTKGFRVIPVNPSNAGTILLGETIYPDLESISDKFEMVDIFRKSEDAGTITDQAIKLRSKNEIKVVWMQIGVRDYEAAKRATNSNLKVVMDRCPKIEMGRLYGELSWSGINSRIISSKRPHLNKRMP